MNFTKLTLVLALGLMSNGLSYGQKSAVPKSQAVGAAAKQAPALREIKLTAEQKRLRQFNTVELGAHNKVWERIEYKLDKHGKLTSQPHRYEELATGMHYRQGGKWFPTEEKIEILPNSAGAIAVKGPHKAIFPVELKSGIIELQTPDEHWMRSRVWGLAYYDTSTGESVLLAEVKESDGQVVGDNVVVYPDAFTDVVADVRYTYTRSGFEQDVVMRAQPTGPEKFGLNLKTTRLQVLTEFVESPRPSKSPRNKDGMTDETLGFGDMTIGSGKAFSVDAAGAQTGDVSVSKEWGVLENRNFLIEQVHFEKVSEQLKKLPAAKAYKGASLERRGKGESVLVGLKNLVPKRYVKSTAPPNKTRQMAKVTTSATPSFVMDYQVVTDQPNYTFKGDTTYSITGPVNLSGTTTIEGGAVLKYYTNATTLNILGTVDCKTEPYRPAVFTTFNDNTVGEVVPGQGSTPPPCSGSFTLHVVNDSDYQVSISIYDDANNYVGSPVDILDWSSVDITFTAENQKHYTFWAGDTQTGGSTWVFNGEFWPTLQNGLMYLDNGANTFYAESGSALCNPAINLPTIALSLANGGVLHDLRINKKDIGVYSPEDFSITNVQFLSCDVAMKTITASFYAGNVLMSDVTTAFDGDTYAGIVEHLTFDQGVRITGGTGSSTMKLVNSLITGVSAGNGVVTPTLDHVYANANSAGYYKTVGAGGHYLNISPLRNVGTTSINAGLAAELKKKTTYAPILRSSYTVSANETWNPTALRDTDTPDIGYHYDPIDYTVKNVTVANGKTLLLTNGVCIALNPLGSGNGINLNPGSSIISEGTPKNLNRVVFAHVVQEVTSMTLPGRLIAVNNATPEPNCSFRFTAMSACGSSWNDKFIETPEMGSGSMGFKDCQSYGGSVLCPGYNLNITNSVLDGVQVEFVNYSANVILYNNTFRRGSLSLLLTTEYDNPVTSRVFDNLFDGTAISVSGGYLIQNHGNNGYSPGNSRLSPIKGSDVPLTSSPVYSSGPLGKWYLNSTTPTLTDKGSRTPADAGLYHYTVNTAANLKDATPKVDIGFHYVGTGSDGNLIDSDHDGAADYFEDRNGNGVYDPSTDPSNFDNPDSDGDGLPDGWEINYGLNPKSSIDNDGATGDPDADYLTNLEEYQIGSDPTKVELTVASHKTTVEDKTYVEVTNLSGKDIVGGSFNLFVYYTAGQRTLLKALEPWLPSDVLLAGSTRTFTFCTPATVPSITTFDCVVIHQGVNHSEASRKFKVINRDEIAQLFKNTTFIPNPCLECGNCPQNAPLLIPPLPRLHCDSKLFPPQVSCDSRLETPLPCGPWAQPLPALADPARGGAKQVDNFYAAASPAEQVNASQTKKGFKNVYGIKQWPGRWGFNSPASEVVTSFFEAGDCESASANNAPDTTKYRTISAQASCEYTTTCNTGLDYSAQSVRSSTVDRYSGIMTGVGSESASGADKYVKKSAQEAARRMLAFADGCNRGKPYNLYIKTVSDYLLQMWGSDTVNFSGSGGAWTATFNFGSHIATVSVDIAAGGYAHHVFPLTWLEDTIDETLTVGPTSLSYVYSNIRTPEGGLCVMHSQSTVSASLSNPYTSAQVNADTDSLLAQWNLVDDVEYPWRTDSGLNRGPLVTYNEKGASPTLGFPVTVYDNTPFPIPLPENFDPDQWIADHQKPWIEQGYENGVARNPSVLLPWPSQVPGAILGAPLPVHGPNGALYAYEPYFNFHHINYQFDGANVGIEGYPASRGAYSPFPNATQWIDDDAARIMPAGPFWAYGSIVGRDHFRFWLKKDIADTDGNWYQNTGVGGCLVKCKWAETIDDPLPPGKDFVFKDWKFNFRDFEESYRTVIQAYYRNSVINPGRATSIPVQTPCPTLSATPVRFTVLGDNYVNGNIIGPGSWWIKEMTTSPLHYDYNCCTPAVFVQPTAPGPGCNGVFVQMPGAVCDEGYGSLWMGRVDQSTANIHACDNYVANRNVGVPNLATCDPPIDLELFWHQRYDVHGSPSGSGYELLVRPPPFPNTTKVNIDITRKNGSVVPEILEQSSGSVVQLVPQSNPSLLYPSGIFLDLVNMSVQPASLWDIGVIKLKKVGPSVSQGKIRVYRKLPTDTDFSIFLGENDTEQILSAADLSASWKLDSTAGGVVDLALVAEYPAGTELCRDTVRVSSIPCEPADGRIVFVNPNSTSAGPPFHDFEHNAAHTIKDAVAIMQPDDNILIAVHGYPESDLVIPVGGVIAGLGGHWTSPDPATTAYPISDVFDYASLPVLDGLIVASGIPAVRANAISSGTRLSFGGLRFENCWAADSNLVRLSGGAILLENISSVPVRISNCRFGTNVANNFGGAIYLSSVSDAEVNACAFVENIAERNAVTFAINDKGMGGAIASVESTLTVSNSAFIKNKALVSALGGAPPLGSAGGGGDVYVTNGVFKMVNSRSSGAVAGFPMPSIVLGKWDVDAPKFTGDGGSILVHGKTDRGATIGITNCIFEDAIAYGNGGAISISYDSSSLGRGYLVGLINTLKQFTVSRPKELSGNCSGLINDVTFNRCKSAWQGGAVSVNGRLTQIGFSDCHFEDGVAGTFAKEGKGGAISVCGGIQIAENPENLTTLNHCTILSCQATANGGGAYCTIRGNLLLTGNTTFTDCSALKGNGVHSESAQKSGQGGAIHCSAGGFVTLSGATLSDNKAFGNGGGLSVKSATATLQESVSIRLNNAYGTSEESVWGNGGGIFITTGRHDPGDGSVAYVYANDGKLVSTSSGVTVSDNVAARWGGGLYVGWPLSDFVGATAKLENASIANNSASLLVVDVGVSRLPAQIVTENVFSDVLFDGGDDQVHYMFVPDLNFNGTTITGRFPAFPDIGIYQLRSESFNGTPVYTPNSLGKNLLIQP